jgi:glutamate formiminotransferase/glutamate formiminotransferase/formiminotetrahydrofolate cyclodeaminase
MDRIVECVPNFSEGRSQATVQALIDAIASVAGVRLLNHTADRDHHRSVLTVVGDPEEMVEAMFRSIRVATDLIDLRRHSGVHPRVGATDVVPFVPIKGLSMRDCVQAAKRLGHRVGTELEIPVFLYERAASHRDHASLESVRRGGLDGLAFRMATDPDWSPDFGPSQLHETAGAIVIGARPPLVALNVNLLSTDVNVARSIAAKIRQSTGGIRHVKAIGVELASRGMVQVAMNLTDYEATPLHVAYQLPARKSSGWFHVQLSLRRPRRPSGSITSNRRTFLKHKSRPRGLVEKRPTAAGPPWDNPSDCPSRDSSKRLLRPRPFRAEVPLQRWSEPWRRRWGWGPG